MKRLLSKTKIRAVSKEGQPMKLEGYAYRFGDKGFADGMREMIEPGAFEKTDDALMLYQHNPDKLLGREGVNMELTEDDIGLRFSVELPDTSEAKDVYKLVKSGILNGVSVGMDGRETESEMDGDMRVIKKTRLREISLTPSPVYQKSSVLAKSKQKKTKLYPPELL